MSADSFKLSLPVRGRETKDWVVNCFVAHEKAGQPEEFEDYRGGRKTYLGHKGTDFNVPNFRWMDRDFAVYASANGKVVYVRDGETDRSTSRSSPGGYGNHVKIEHPNGFTSLYGHLKKGFISVTRSEGVVAGQKIGVIGSSGSSDGPHLHFELLDRDGKAIDPFEREYWTKPPMYDPPFSIMDFSVQKGSIDCLAEAKTPTRDNVELFSSGEWIGVGLFMSGLQANKNIEISWAVGKRQCRRSFITASEMENLMICHANLDFSEAGEGWIVVRIDKPIVCKHRVEVRCRSERVSVG